MKVLKSWLKDYVDIKVSDIELEEKLSVSGTLVEAVAKLIDPKIIVAEIKDIKAHPNADRLQVAIVHTGTDDLQIVCGAPNIAVGQKVPLAQIGTVLPEGEIRQAEIRGIESFGMMCSERELGLSEAHEGIKILPSTFEVGKPLNQYLDSDAIFELEITPNRGDCLSHFGVAREISAILNENLKEIKSELEIEKSEKKLEVKIEDRELCPQYFAQVIAGVKVQDSPQWLKNRLLALGQKPINNIVDITNYVMFDLGQPLHAFDFSKISGNKIIIRKANNEKIKTLDGSERNLNNEMLVIADADKPIAIAGVMGGANSEVDINTIDIVLEAAEFKMQSVRKTSKQLGVSTEASYRFERAIDSGLVDVALKKAAQMIQKIADGTICEQYFDGVKPKKQTIEIDYKNINELLGLDLEQKEIDNILNSLGFETSGGQCDIPLWRHDVYIWQDLAEEIGRIYGLAKIKSIGPSKDSAPEKSIYFYKEYLKDLLMNLGFSEALTYPFLSENDLKVAKLSTESLLEVSNPIQKENKYLRSSLIPGLLKAVAKNPAFDQVFLFEIGNVFSKTNEKTNLAIVVSGKNAKNAIEEAIDKLAEITSISKSIFEINELYRDDLVRYKIKKPMTYAIEISIDKIFEKLNLEDEKLKLKIKDSDIKYRQVSKYPAVVRDVAFIVDESVDSKQIEKGITDSSPEILLIEKFDEFSSDKFGVNKKNVAYHLWFQNIDKTITDSEIEIVMKRIIEKQEKQFNAKLRS